MASSASQAKAAAILEVSQLRTRIEAALDQRGRHYACYFTFAIRFEKDDTGAEKDTSNFQTILKMLGLPVAMEMVIPSGDVTPGWSVNTWLAKLIESRKLKTGRALVIGHYAGHGGIDSRGQLYFHASPQYPSSMLYVKTIDNFFDESDVPPDTDVCMILDACYSGVATRGVEGRNWTAELVAAVGPQQKALGNWSYLARTQNKTFTSRVADEVAREVGKGATGISLADIVSTLRQHSSSDRKPIYQLKAGMFGIRIPNLKNVSFPPHQRTFSQHQRRQAALSAPAASSSVLPSITSPSHGSLQPFATPSGLSAVFQVHLNAVDPTGPEAQKLLDWLLSLGEELGIKLMGVYKTKSTTMLFHVPWVLWAHLDGLSGFELVCEPTGRNLLGPLMNRIQSPASMAGSSSTSQGLQQKVQMKENIPFR
jgi:hypothetical protein